MCCCWQPLGKLIKIAKSKHCKHGKEHHQLCGEMLYSLAWSTRDQDREEKWEALEVESSSSNWKPKEKAFLIVSSRIFELWFHAEKWLKKFVYFLIVINCMFRNAHFGLSCCVRFYWQSLEVDGKICIISLWLPVSPLYGDLWKQINLHCITNSTKKKVFIYFWLKGANDSLHAVISWVYQQNANLLAFVRYFTYNSGFFNCWARTLLLPLYDCFPSPLEKDANFN